MGKFGLAFCFTYLLAILTCLGFALTADGDLKGQFVFAQIPIALQGSLGLHWDLARRWPDSRGPKPICIWPDLRSYCSMRWVG